MRAWLLAFGAPALVVGLLLPARDTGPMALALVVLLAVVLLVARIGGPAPAAAATLNGLVLVGCFLVRPFEHRAGSTRGWDLLAIAGFAGLAVWAIRLTDRTDEAEPASAADDGQVRGDGGPSEALTP